MDHFSDRTAALPILSRALLAMTLLVACSQTALADDDSTSCQASGWDMTRELNAFASVARQVMAGGAVPNAPIVAADTLYALELRPQSNVHFIQESPNAPRASASMAGLAKFTVRSSGRYRVTVDTALWIDAVDSKQIVGPSSYITWHQCQHYRKSVEYRLQAGGSVTLQFSGASAATAHVVIELIPD